MGADKILCARPGNGARIERSLRRPEWHLESPTLRALSIEDLFDIVARHALHFDQARQTGVIFHMISCLTEHGRVGMTAVGDSPAQAEATYQRAQRVLLEEAEAALRGPSVPT